MISDFEPLDPDNPKRELFELYRRYDRRPADGGSSKPAGVPADLWATARRRGLRVIYCPHHGAPFEAVYEVRTSRGELLAGDVHRGDRRLTLDELRVFVDQPR